MHRFSFLCSLRGTFASQSVHSWRRGFKLCTYQPPPPVGYRRKLDFYLPTTTPYPRTYAQAPLHHLKQNSGKMSAIYAHQNTAVITGGASGIGLALTKKCVGYGMRVLVADYDEKSLDAAKKALGGDKIETVKIDVGDIGDWAVVKEKVEKDFGGKINLLALNAGTGVRVSFADADTSGFEKILRTNLFGVINGISTLLPLVKAHASTASPAAVVITGSKQGITNPPGNPAYNASKAAVKTLAEHLSFDLAASHPGVIGVHLLVPGWTWTPLAGASGGREKPDAAWTPEQVVDYLEKEMAEGQFWVLCPDNDVTEDMDKRRMQWNTNDVILGRPPLSRWRDEYKDEFKEFMEQK